MFTVTHDEQPVFPDERKNKGNQKKVRTSLIQHLR